MNKSSIEKHRPTLIKRITQRNTAKFIFLIKVIANNETYEPNMRKINKEISPM
jgi:hypothetical protein